MDAATLDKIAKIRGKQRKFGIFFFEILCQKFNDQNLNFQNLTVQNLW